MYKSYTYLIKCTPTGQLYYGARYSKNRTHMTPDQDLWVDYFTSSDKVHQLIEEYGKDAFEISIDKVFDTPEEAIEYEKNYLTEADITQDVWLNGNVAGGIVPSEENFKKISEFHKGKPKSEDHKKKISEANTGKTRPWSSGNLPNTSGKLNGRYGVEVSQSTRDKISAANKGKPAHNKGKPMSEEQKAKISVAKKGKKQNPEIVKRRAKAQTGLKRSDATKQKIKDGVSAYLVANPRPSMSDETKAKISAATKGKKRSEATKAKMREAWSRRRNG
jgi:hypothetical protein